MKRAFVRLQRENEDVDFIIINLDKIEFAYFKDTFKGRKYFVAIGEKHIKVDRDGYLYIWDALTDKTINENNVNLYIKNKVEKENGKGTD